MMCRIKDRLDFIHINNIVYRMYSDSTQRRLEVYNFGFSEYVKEEILQTEHNVYSIYNIFVI